MLAEAATLTATDEAGDIHLCRRFCEGEVRGAQTDAGVWAEHLLGKRQEDLFEVGERNVLVDIEAFHLMEETVGTGSDSLVAIDTTRTDNTDGSGEFTVLGVHVFHHILVMGILVMDRHLGHVGAWQAYLLSVSKTVLPFSGITYYTKRLLIFQREQLKDIRSLGFKKIEGLNNLETDLFPKIKIDGNKAVVSSCYWSDWGGLFRESVEITFLENGKVKIGDFTKENIFEYDVGFRF